MVVFDVGEGGAAEAVGEEAGFFVVASRLAAEGRVPFGGGGCDKIAPYKRVNYGN